VAICQIKYALTHFQISWKKEIHLYGEKNAAIAAIAATTVIALLMPPSCSCRWLCNF
jgi:hypothetical protein